MGEHQLDVYLMNTGRVGGADDVEGSEKVRIKHSSAIVKAIAEGTIEWTEDPDFGYQVAKSVPGIDDDDPVLRPKDLYEKLGRSDEYGKIVDTLKTERTEYLRKYPALSDQIVAAVS
jgi:phosphoenolpyruvate carboxykinase (ATP)